MLPPALQHLKEQLERERNPTEEQRTLLEELRVFDRDRRTPDILREERLDKATRIVSGPGDRCSCCGKSL